MDNVCNEGVWGCIRKEPAKRERAKRLAETSERLQTQLPGELTNGRRLPFHVFFFAQCLGSLIVVLLECAFPAVTTWQVPRRFVAGACPI
jgi:hypothetical protein